MALENDQTKIIILLVWLSTEAVASFHSPVLLFPVQSLTRLPVLIEAVGRAVSNETETINRNMDAIMLKLTALQVKIDDFRDQNGQRE